MRRFSRKTTVLSAGLAFLVIGGGVAFAYWTGGGSGVGTAATGTTSNVTAVQTSTVTAMGPGVPAQTLTGNFTNASPSPVYVTAVTASISSVVKAAGAPAGTCDATDYTLASPIMPVGAEVPVSATGTGSWTGATIAFNNTGVNQDGCKGATVNLLYTVS